MFRQLIGPLGAFAGRVAAACLCLAATVAAQGVQTGTISGSVTDAQQAVLPGVTVTAESSALQGARVAVSDATGAYIFRGLPPGQYVLRFELQGMRTVEEGAEVRLGGSTQVDVAMALATVTEAVEVRASVTPAPLETPNVGANYGYDEVNALPAPRTLSGIAELAPGVTDNTPNAGQVTIAGSFAYDNVFLVDGVDINDNLFGTPNNLFIEDALEETQVLTGGVSAEYGRFSGGVINAITKSGGNEYAGTFRVNLTNPSWTDETPFERDEGITRESDISQSYEATFGGPIVRDRLWFFSAGRFADTAESGTFPELGLPVVRTEENTRYELKGTGTLAQNHTVSATYIGNETDQTRPSFTFSIDPNTIVSRKLPNDLFVANYRGVLSPSLFATLQYSRKQFGFRNTGGTSTDIFDSPFLSRGVAEGVPESLHYNAPYFDSTDPEDRDNQQVAGTLSYFGSTERLGYHDVKGGFEVFTSTNTGGNSQSATDYVFQADYRVDAAGNPVLDGQGNFIPVFVPGVSRVLNWRATRGAELDIRTTSLFLQDSWTLNNRLSFDLGLRYERVRSEATGGIVGVDTDTVMPRLAAAWNPWGGSTVFRATYGHYSGKYSEAQFGGNTPVGNPALLLGIYDGPAGEGDRFAPGFDVGNYPIVFGDFPTANVFFEDGLSSPVSREFTLQAGTQMLGGRGYVEAVYIQRNFENFVEDFITIDTGDTTIIEDGQNFGTFDNSVFRNSDEPVRRYKGLQFQSRYRVTPRFTVNGHWTVQLENEGNFEGEATNQPAISSLLGDFPEVFRESRNFPVGRLDAFQRHKVRAWGVYTMPLGEWGEPTLALLYRYDSPLTFSLAAAGVPLTDQQLAIAEAAGYASTPNAGSQTLYFGARGTERFEAAHLFDVAVNYQIPVWRTLRPYLELEMFNVFNTSPLIEHNTAITADFDGPVDDLGLPLTFTRGPRFGQATDEDHFPRARTVQLSLGFRF
ncbi:MAG TPA: TonB-dependent receptor [Vicinamibacterales bacterium]|nr:TonB-dependent receptor [Vicinamibacterales bacterium]